MTEEEKEEEKKRELIVINLMEKIADDLLKSNRYAGKTAQELLNDDNLYNEVAELVVFEATLLGIEVKKNYDGEHRLMYVY